MQIYTLTSLLLFLGTLLWSVILLVWGVTEALLVHVYLSSLKKSMINSFIVHLVEFNRKKIMSSIPYHFLRGKYTKTFRQVVCMMLQKEHTTFYHKCVFICVCMYMLVNTFNPLQYLVYTSTNSIHFGNSLHKSL